MFRVLGIDPGYDRLGAAIVEHSGSEHVIDSRCIVTDKQHVAPARLQTIGDEIGMLLDSDPCR